MYIENQASRHSPPPSLRTIRQPIAVWGALSVNLLRFGENSMKRVGGHVRERELGSRDHVTYYTITRPCHVTISGRRGGGPTAS